MTLTITGTDTIHLFQVGGCVRDTFLGVKSKDIDFAVEAPSFSAMRDFLVARGFEIFLETPEFLTIRARFPKTLSRLTVDFVLCRRDGRSSNSRHPDSVEPGTILDDLARRDFTVNAMAIDEMGELLDPHGGRQDLEAMSLRFVGDPFTRLLEDSLRALRAVRFSVTKGFSLAPSTLDALRDPLLPTLLQSVSTERIREELDRAFRSDTLATLRLLDRLNLTDCLFTRPGLRLKPTMED